ncbi:TetR family transcriptional regulator [Pseudoduganella sp. DS3]|uniref:TetR family transcriptional regulator n=1 Tax=Pseudoduganella guangdongensis TaxID=2692179 RepID=A0A6N9HK89_9BURK|nr:TetR/AcrR family transcriptional regulator [Pseudoduganella guangdongensis]MYN03920.1 TetR family transcriptional regulator [Pseudoduganella guangdongensis]
MARPKSEEKRLHLMLAAAEAVAERGVGAPTALIAKLAGVAEGTLFRYFPTKEALLNETYLYICELGWASANESFDLSRPLIERARHLWDMHVDWCLANPVWDRALSQLAVTEILTKETRAAEAAMFPDVGLMEQVSAGEVLAGHPTEYADALFLAVANATIEFARREPERVEAYKASGFAAFRRMFLD